MGIGDYDQPRVDLVGLSPIAADFAGRSIATMATVAVAGCSATSPYPGQTNNLYPNQAAGAPGQGQLLPVQELRRARVLWHTSIQRLAA